MPGNAHRVAIVGLGPKGLYCLERLVACCAASALRQPLHIDLFNGSSAFGCSPVYDPALPDYLLVNIKVGEVDLWEPLDPPVVAREGRDFVSWYQATHPERDPISGEEYLPRAEVGRYLIDGCRRILDQLPPGVSIGCHVGEVVDVERVGHGLVVRHRGPAGGESLWADRVILATGHATPQLHGDALHWAQFASEHPGVTFVPAVYPVTKLLGAVSPGATVAMLGIGLTFIDGVLALTEGRGGSFRRDGAGGLGYVRSGEEPARILPFSRSGLPMSPKAFDTGSHPQPLSFVRPDLLARLQRQAPGGRLELVRDIWPLIDLELQLRYLRVMLPDCPERAQLESAAGEPAASRRVLTRLAETNPTWGPLDIPTLLDPAATETFRDGAAFNRFVSACMATDIGRAQLGQSGSGVRAAAESWYQIRAVLGDLFASCALDPASHRRLAEEVFPKFKRVAFGPPIVNIEKLQALQRCGVLDFRMARGPSVSPDRSASSFVLRSGLCPGEQLNVTTLVDARYPAVDLTADASPLFQALRRRGTVRPFVNPPGAAGGSPYQTGAVDMTAGTQLLIGRDGRPDPGMAMIGIPTEGKVIGNFSLTRDPFAGAWAREVVNYFLWQETREPADVGGRPAWAAS